MNTSFAQWSLRHPVHPMTLPSHLFSHRQEVGNLSIALHADSFSSIFSTRTISRVGLHATLHKISAPLQEGSDSLNRSSWLSWCILETTGDHLLCTTSTTDHCVQHYTFDMQRPFEAKPRSQEWESSLKCENSKVTKTAIELKNRCCVFALLADWRALAFASHLSHSHERTSSEDEEDMRILGYRATAPKSASGVRGNKCCWYAAI